LREKFLARVDMKISLCGTFEIELAADGVIGVINNRCGWVNLNPARRSIPIHDAFENVV
jgi:hypothetical protein